MSGLVIQGNLIERLGRYFPAPYIERIILNPDNIQVSVSMMFETDETEYFDELIEQLQEELYVYVALIWDIDNINNILNKTLTPLDPSVVKYLLSSAASAGYTMPTVGPLGYGRPASTGPSTPAMVGSGAGGHPGISSAGIVTGMPSGFGEALGEYLGSTETAEEEEGIFNIIQIPFSSFVKSTETIVSDTDKTIVRYDLGSIYDSTDEQFVFGPDIESFLSMIQTDTEDLMVFAFSSILDYDTLNEGLYSTFYATATIETTDAFDNKLANSALMEREISDVSYEALFRDGEIVSGEEIVFVDPQDTIYENTPIKTLDGVYRKTDSITHGQLVNAFYQPSLYDSMSDEGTSPVEDAAFVARQSFRDSINAVLAEYGYSTDILLRLNDFRKTVPEKTNATPVGQEYEIFATRLAMVNGRVLASDALAKKKIRNPKIIDNLTRGEILTGWTEPDPPDYNEDDCLYPDIFMTRWAVWENTPESDEFNAAGEVVTDPAYCLNTGYIFFDFEKVVRGLTTVSKIFDMKTFEKVFGTSLTNAHLRWSQVMCKVNESMTSDFYAYYTRFSQFNDPKTNLQNNSLDIDYYMANPVSSGESLTAMIELNGKDTPRYFGVPRSFNLASEIGLYDSETEHDYRLLALEFADYCTYDNRKSYDSYDVTVSIHDYTYLIPKKIIGDYTDQFDASDEHSLASYLEAASEACSYNDLQDMFNAFFADGIMAKYEGNYNNAPWVRAPLLYALHLDFMLNTFNHEIDEILEYARQIIASISPTTGTFEQLQAFYELYTEFYDEIYGDSTFQALLADIAATGLVKLYFQQTYEIDGTIIHSWQTGEWSPAERATYLFMMPWKKYLSADPEPYSASRGEWLGLVDSCWDTLSPSESQENDMKTRTDAVLEAMQSTSQENFLDTFCEMIISIIWDIESTGAMTDGLLLPIGRYIICSQHDYWDSGAIKKPGLAENCRNPDYEEAKDVIQSIRRTTASGGWGNALDRTEEFAVAFALAIMWPNSSKRDTDKDNWKGDMYTSSDMGSHDIEDMQENEINWITELKARGYWDEDYESWPWQSS